MHTSFDYVRRSRYSNSPICSGLTHSNSLACYNYANANIGGVGVDFRIQWGTGPAGSGNGLGDHDWGHRAHLESYLSTPDGYLGPDLFCAYRNTRHSPLP